jgi:hypothetical protein
VLHPPDPVLFSGGVFDGWNWDTHPVYFGYAAVLIAALWLVYRLLLSVERLSGKTKAPTPEGAGADVQESGSERTDQTGDGL